MEDRNSSFSVVFSERATDMLLQHVRFMAQVSLHAAEQLRVDIIEAALSLEKFPQRNTFLTDLVLPENKYRKMIVNKRYMIIYQIKDLIVLIDYIIDCRQEYQWLL